MEEITITPEEAAMLRGGAQGVAGEKPMEIIIKGEAKEIAALLLAVARRQELQNVAERVTVATEEDVDNLSRRLNEKLKLCQQR